MSAKPSVAVLPILAAVSLLLRPAAAWPLRTMELETSDWLTACPASWSSYGSSCLRLSSDRRSWSDALDQCDILLPGATLATVADPFQVPLLKQMLKQSGEEGAWIGLSAQTSEGRQLWDWADGRELQFKLWEPTEATTEGEHQPESRQCVVMTTRRGRWRAEPCSASWRYFCAYQLQKE